MTESHFPLYTRAEQIADASVHLAGVTFSLVATFRLLDAATNLDAADVAGLCAYCAGLVAMFGTSASYNLTRRGRVKEFLRRADHAAIYFMIAGSYTPFALQMDGIAGAALLLSVWPIGLLGAYLVLRYPRRFERTALVLYLIQGWTILFAIGPLINAVPSFSTRLLLLGGVIYTAGVAFHLMRWMKFHNVIWHAFVLAGAAIHFFAIQAAVFD